MTARNNFLKTHSQYLRSHTVFPLHPCSCRRNHNFIRLSPSQFNIYFYNQTNISHPKPYYKKINVPHWLPDFDVCAIFIQYGIKRKILIRCKGNKVFLSLKLLFHSRFSTFSKNFQLQCLLPLWIFSEHSQMQSSKPPLQLRFLISWVRLRFKFLRLIIMLQFLIFSKL